MTRRRWFDRRFVPGLPPEAFPDIVERVRGTPARVEDLVRHYPEPLRIHRPDGSWSIQENVGHLLDLESLWAGRLDDLLEGAPVLRPADLQNTRTHEGAHNERPLARILAEFRAAREATAARLDALEEAALACTARHPRLDQPMTAVDLFFFVAEHDDHHLARITEIARAGMP